MLRSGNGLNALLLLAVVICALSVVTSQHKARKLYVELQKEKGYAHQMEVEWGQLQLEQSTWAAPARVEKIAVQQLHMRLPKNGEVNFIRAGAGGSGEGTALDRNTQAGTGSAATLHKFQVNGLIDKRP